jgi:cell division protein FtsB
MNKKSLLPYIVFLIAGFIVYRVFFGSSGMINQYFISRDNENLRTAIDSVKILIEEKEIEIERLLNDTVYLEYLARTRLGMSLKDETVIRFSSKDSVKK